MEVEVARLADFESDSISFIMASISGGGSLLSPFTRLLLGGEVERHGPRVAVSCLDVERAEDVGAVLLEVDGVVVHELASPPGVVRPALHDLHEPRRVRVTLEVDVDLGAVVELRLAVEELRRLLPPRCLFRSAAVLCCAASSDSNRARAMNVPSSVTPVVLPSHPVAPGARSACHLSRTARTLPASDTLPWNTWTNIARSLQPDAEHVTRLLVDATQGEMRVNAGLLR